MKKSVLLFTLLLATVFSSLAAETITYSAQVQNESGPGYEISISYPFFGGKLKAVDAKIVECVETDIEFLKRHCLHNTMGDRLYYDDWAEKDLDFRKKYDSLTGGHDLIPPQRSFSEYKKWLMSSKGSDTIKLLQQKLSEHGEVPISYSYELYHTVYVDGDLLSVYLDEIDYSGGGNGNHEHIVTLNYDMKRRKFVTLEEVTGVSTEKLTSLLAEDLCRRYGASPAEALMERSYEGTEAFPAFIRRGGTIIVYFNPYEIASGAEGVLEAYIFTSDLNHN